MEYSIKHYYEKDKIIYYILRVGNFTYLFWIPKDKVSSKIVDIFIENENCILKDGRIGLSLNSNKDISGILVCINIFRKEMSLDENNVSLCFVPFNHIEKELFTNLGSMLDISYSIDESNMPLENKQESVEEKVVYLNGSDIYADASCNNYIGTINQNGYVINWENNSIENGGKLVGKIGERKLGATGGKVNTRTLAPSYLNSAPMCSAVSSEPSGEIRSAKKNAAFITLPAIIFIISALFFIASIILLFVLD